MTPQDQPSGQSQDRHDFNPGQTISPREGNPSPAPAAEPATTPVAPVQQSAAPEPEPQQNFYQPNNDVADVASQQLAVADNNVTPLDAQMQDNGREVTWTALEFIAHQKSASWFVAMGGVAAVIAVLVYIITRDVFNLVVILIAAVIFAVAAGRPPRQMQYTVDDHGIEIGRRFYPYSEFRSFSIADEGPFRSLVFMPLKRFMPQMTIYYDPEDEDRIGEVLIEHLPMHEHRHDMTDRLMKRIRF